MKKIGIGVTAVLIVIFGGIYLTQKQESGQPDQKSQESSPTPPPTVEPSPTPSEAPPPASPSPIPPSPEPTPSPEPPSPTPTPPTSAQTKTFGVSGQNFAFTPAEIRVKRGDLVKINFESTGGFHDWTVEGFAVGTTQVNTGQKTSVEFGADKAGTFTFYCSVGNHRQMGMVGVLIVE